MGTARTKGADWDGKVELTLNAHVPEHQETLTGALFRVQRLAKKAVGSGLYSRASGLDGERHSSSSNLRR